METWVASVLAIVNNAAMHMGVHMSFRVVFLSFRSISRSRIAGTHGSFFLFFLFLAALGLHCCRRAFSSCDEWGLLLVAVHRLLIAVASLVVEQFWCVGSVVAACRLQ